MKKLLSKIESPDDLKKLSRCQLPELAQELRQYILESVAKTGGHLSSNLGTVELTVALHYLFNTPDDRLIWDVGHQAYAHKVLTGRRDDLPFIRRQNHISGFPKRSESSYDAFGTAHSSTSISAALGMAVAARNQGHRQRHHIAVIGDGAMTAGMVFEAMNNAGDTSGINLLVVLNDNDMSISPPVGALNKYFSRLISTGLPLYKEASDMSKVMLEQLPEPMAEFARRFKGHVKDQAKSLMGANTLFEEFGFNYIGPIDGHDLDALLPVLDNVRRLGGLQFVHVITKKGQGYELAEEDPVLYHGPGKFNPSEGIKSSGAASKQTFTQVFGRWLCDMGAADNKLIGITPAMREGSGLVEFEKRFPERYFDVGIAEQHAVTFAAGIACEGLKPVVAIYSTFLQRAYDQLIHDVALQNLDVTFALDRAGLVGADGATHAGNYDIAYLRCIPNMVVSVPSDEQECRLLLSSCYQYEGPSSVRYPRGAGIGAETSSDLQTVAIGKAVQCRHGSKIAILAFGPLLHEARQVADKYDLSLIDMRFVKPLDEEMILELAKSHQGFVTLEEGALMGGAGSAVIEFLNQHDINLSVLQLGYPDLFIDHGDQNALRADLKLDAKGIEHSIEQRFAELLKT